METWTGFAANLVSTEFSALASEFFATQAGVSALITYYLNLEPNTPWQTTFNQTFGVSPEEFYQQFEAHAQAGFLDLRVPDRESVPGGKAPPCLSEGGYVDPIFRVYEGRWSFQTCAGTRCPTGSPREDLPL